MSPASGSSNDGNKPKVGRVRHDSSGRAIWEWAADTGKHALDSTSRLLKRLDIPGLSLADDPKVKKEEDEDHSFGAPKEEDPLQKKRRSFNPYESRLPPKIQAPPPTAKAAPTPPATPPAKPAPPRRLSKEEQEAETKRGWFSRLLGR